MKLSSKYRRLLSERERLCILLPALYALGKRENARRLMHRAVTARKLPTSFFAELFLHLSLLIGFPNMLDGLESLAQVRVRSARRLCAEHRTRRRLRESGMKVLRTIYGNQTEKLLGSLARLHADLPRMIVEDVYGRIIARAGMTIAERELVNVTVLTIQGLNRQLYSHLRGALRVGVSPEVLRTLLGILRLYFRVRVGEAERLLQRLTASKN
jgi:alkylhydroperoxidase/carboxymuconolactone decarboxylase family protein YurZ